jgi:deferrochelatase/peroxidase EfeB
MTRLDPFDIQGNIVRPYGRFGFPYARYMAFNIHSAAAGRWFIDQIRPQITTAEPWRNSKTPTEANVRDKPPVALNIAFTWRGLLALELPTATLQAMPPEFIEGMASRKSILGDLDPSDPKNWDEVWRHSTHADPACVHVLVMLNAQPDPATGQPVKELDAWTNWFRQLVKYPETDGQVILLRGHGRRPGAPEAENDDYQDSNTVMRRGRDGKLYPTPTEPFGFMDGISDPDFAGLHDETVPAIGGGKIMPGPFDPMKSWAPLAAGEFLLGQPSEGQETPPSAPPWAFMRNGTFMALRKLHQNTRTFDETMATHAAAYKEVGGFASVEDAAETLKAKLVGRWSFGIPLVAAPTLAEARQLMAQYAPVLAKVEAVGEDGLTRDEKLKYQAFENLLVNFRYIDDPGGVKCPFGAHLRRVNPRDMLDPDPDNRRLRQTTTRLTNRRRILRRGLPYGPIDPDAFAASKQTDEAEHGVFIMALCTSLFRQFEFIQQQWIQYGLDLESGNDTCPIVGRRDPNNPAANKFVIPADPKSDQAPYIAAGLPQFVETRGGEYFFIPSVTALRMMAMGSVDPT